MINITAVITILLGLSMNKINYASHAISASVKKQHAGILI
jgi:hypothetical protein